MKPIFENILAAIGDTPIVRLNRLGARVASTIYVKCEFVNPGGSIKDRIGVGMIEAAERDGRIRPGHEMAFSRNRFPLFGIMR